MMTRSGLIVLFLVVGLLLPGCRQSAPKPQPPKIGALYHFWKAEDFQRGYLRARLEPPQYPQAGHYNSYDPSTIENHIRMASRSGVDFFALLGSQEWEGSELRLEAYLGASNVEDISFCWVSVGVSGEAFEKEMGQISKRLFEHPSYLRLGDRPVVFLRGSYTWNQEQLEVFKKVRQRLKGAGQDVFWVAEELNWDAGKVPDVGGERAQEFDALTGIRVQWRSRSFRWRGYAAASALLADLGELAEQARGGPVPYVPTIFPGYNGNGPEGALPGYVIPREWRVGAGGEGLFREMIRFGKGAIDPRAPLMLINSWNGWTEDTAIEPVEEAAPTQKDQDNFRYSHFFTYEGYGTRLLDELKAATVALEGRALTHSGYPATGVTVSAWNEQRLLATARCDSRGYFSLPRTREEGKEVRLGRDRASSRIVSLEPDRTVIANLYLSGEPEGEAEPLFPALKAGQGTFSPQEHDLVQVGEDRLRADTPWVAWGESLEQRLTDLVQPGEAVLDLGAGAGLQSVALGRLIGPQSHLYAVEPDQEKLKMLSHNLKAVGLEQITTLDMRALEEPDFPKVVLVHVGRVKLLDEAGPLLQRWRPWLLLKLESSQPNQPSLILGQLFGRGFRTFPYQHGYRLAQPLSDEPGVVRVDAGPEPMAAGVRLSGFGNGEAELGKTYAWSNQGSVTVEFELAEVSAEEPYAMGLSARCFAPLSPLKAELTLNGRPAGTVELKESWAGYELNLPKGAVADGHNTLVFQFERTGKPSDFDPQSPDHRSLAMALDLLWVAQAGSKR